MEYRNVRNYILEGFYSIAEGMSNLTIFPKKISTLEEIYNNQKKALYYFNLASLRDKQSTLFDNKESNNRDRYIFTQSDTKDINWFSVSY